MTSPWEYCQNPLDATTIVYNFEKLPKIIYCVSSPNITKTIA